MFAVGQTGGATLRASDNCIADTPSGWVPARRPFRRVLRNANCASGGFNVIGLGDRRDGHRAS